MGRKDVDQISIEPKYKLHLRYKSPEALTNPNAKVSLNVNNTICLNASLSSNKDLNPNLLCDTDCDFAVEPELYDDSWEMMYDRFKCFANQYGHTIIPQHSEFDNLKDWINRQIINRRHLSESQFLKLDKLGIIWYTVQSRDHAWDLMYERLQAFKKEFGHCRVPTGWSEDKQLALWVMRQRKLYSKGSIIEYRRKLLIGIGFIWKIQEVYDKQWEDYFQKLVKFCKELGHCNVPGKEIKLVSWMERQRLLKKKGQLTATRTNRLNDLNFIWDFDPIKKTDWEQKYRQLCDFHELHGHSFVPNNYKKNKQLGIWVATQRKHEVNGTLSKPRLQKLNNINFVWSRDIKDKLKSEYDSLWETRFEKLVAYKQAYGTCQVSLKMDPVLQSWTIWQRKLFYAGRIAPDRIARLNSISFPWNINEGYWHKMFEQLSSFYTRFGHTRVPAHWEENPRLAAWAYRLRADKDNIDSPKVFLLNSLGFEWTIQHKTIVGWKVMYERLLTFKLEFGHTRVPAKWIKDPKLGKWVSRMRSEKKKISEDRLLLLKNAGFHW